jgi:hypothetical protein
LHSAGVQHSSVESDDQAIARLPEHPWAQVTHSDLARRTKFRQSLRRCRQMAEIVLTQAEADALIAMDKFRTDDAQWNYPRGGEQLSVPLTSSDRRELFALDITRSAIKLTKSTHQNRARQAIVLLRLDLDGPPHRNPDGVEIPCPHLHAYKEGYGDKWASPAPAHLAQPGADAYSTCVAFMAFCKIVEAPFFVVGLF